VRVERRNLNHSPQPDVAGAETASAGPSMGGAGRGRRIVRTGSCGGAHHFIDGGADAPRMQISRGRIVFGRLGPEGGPQSVGTEGNPPGLQEKRGCLIVKSL